MERMGRRWDLGTLSLVCSTLRITFVSEKRMLPELLELRKLLFKVFVETVPHLKSVVICSIYDHVQELESHSGFGSGGVQFVSHFKDNDNDSISVLNESYDIQFSTNAYN